MISAEDWALIRRLVADGVPRRQVARELRIGRATVDRALASDRPPKYERAPVVTSFAPFEARVRALLAQHPEMPATVIAERVEWAGSITWFRDNLRQLRAHYRRPDPADRQTWHAGDAVQCDLWFPPKRIPLEDGSTTLLPVLVIVAAHCTNYVAYVESHTYSVPSPGNELGNASTWGTRAPAHGATVDHNPTIGSVAWWSGTAGLGSAGHVAIVEAVGNGTVTVSEDVYIKAGDYSGDNFDWKTYSTSGITGFIHFKGQTAGGGGGSAGMSTPPLIGVALTAGEAFAKVGGLPTQWTEEMGGISRAASAG